MTFVASLAVVAAIGITRTVALVARDGYGRTPSLRRA